MSSSDLLVFGNLLVDFTFSNPALYAALCIPTCVNTTFHLSTSKHRIGVNMRTWVEISAQIGSVVAIGFANIIPLVILFWYNSDSLTVKIFLVGVAGSYWYFVRGFVISDEQFDEYKSSLGIAFPPWGNRITKARVFGVVIEILVPTYVYMMVCYWAVGEFEVPAILSSLRV